jgi:muramoyltetrapeptide carboxypeptidase
MGSSEKVFRIGLVAPGTRMSKSLAQKAIEVAARQYGDRVELLFHPQCFEQAGHFAGTDRARIDALVEVANDPEIDAVWLARGGYGACRVAEYAIPRLNERARAKKWLGYSDAGFLLAGLYRDGYEHVAHGPMPVDLIREDGEQAVARALAWLVNGASSSLEGGVTPGHPNLAFNLTILSQLLGTPLEPIFRPSLLEDVGEHVPDRSYHVTLER